MNTIILKIFDSTFTEVQCDNLETGLPYMVIGGNWECFSEDDNSIKCFSKQKCPDGYHYAKVVIYHDGYMKIFLKKPVIITSRIHHLFHKGSNKTKVKNLLVWEGYVIPQDVKFSIDGTLTLSYEDEIDKLSVEFSYYGTKAYWNPSQKVFCNTSQQFLTSVNL